MQMRLARARKRRPKSKAEDVDESVMCIHPDARLPKATFAPACAWIRAIMNGNGGRQDVFTATIASCIAERSPHALHGYLASKLTASDRKICSGPKRRRLHRPPGHQERPQ